MKFRCVILVALIVGVSCQQKIEIFNIVNSGGL